MGRCEIIINDETRHPNNIWNLQRGDYVQILDRGPFYMDVMLRVPGYFVDLTTSQLKCITMFKEFRKFNKGDTITIKIK